MDGRRLSILLLAAACLVLPPALARGAKAPGCTVTLGLPGLHEARAMAVQADGKIVVAGWANLGATRDFLVARFHQDLTLDTSFNGTGYRVDDLQLRDDEVYAVAVQFDQKIVVAGYSDNNPSKRFLALARYNRDGSPDTSFDADGFHILDIFGGSAVEEIRDIAIQPDGKIVAVGFDTPGSPRLFVMRLTKAGALDVTFGGGGTASPPLAGTSASLARGVTIDPGDGGILVSGEATLATSDFVLVRLLPDGSFDTGFAGTGWTSLDIGGGTGDTASSIVRQADGRIVVAGTSNGDVAVARYDPNGSLDASFGGTGVVVQDLGGTDSGNAVALDAAGKILVGGESSLPPSRFAFARFLPTGGLDLSKLDDISGLDDWSQAVAITSAGKILLAGSSEGANAKLTLARYKPDGTQDCGSLFLHPTGDATADFPVVVGGCATHANCVNDQVGDAPTGTPAVHDGTATLVESPTAAARELFTLADGQLPPGKVVTEIEVVAQLAWSGTGTAPNAELLYQRQGFDVSPIASSPLAVSNASFLESRFVASSLNWSAAELDALEIGVDHLSGNDLRLTQTYVKVTYGEKLVRPVRAFTAAASGDSTNGEVLLNWLNPASGLYDETVVRRVPSCPAAPTDGVVVASPSDGLGQPGGAVDTVPLGPQYFYAAFVEDAEDHPSAGVCISATPFDRTAGKVEWAYDTAISALTTPGLHVDPPGGKSTVYAVGNDGLVHAVVGGTVAAGGGRWPSGFKPFRVGDAVQSRPPIVPLPPSSTLALLLSSQDGHAYAVDAATGDVIWKSAKLGATLQAAPAAMLSAFGGAQDLAFVATRNSGQPNRLYALDASDGTVVWSFDNGGAATGIGIVVSGPSVDYAAGRVYFTSATGASGQNVWCLDFGAPSPPQPCWAGFGVATGADSEASPILFAGSLLVSESAAAGNLYGVDPATGAPSLLAALGGGGAKGYVFPRFATADVFASTATTVWSVDTAGPSTNWSGACVSTPSTPTAVPFTDFVFLGSTEGKLFQMSASSGSGCPSPPSVCIGDCTSTVVGAPAYDIVQAMLYAGTDEGKVYAVRAPFP